MFISKKHLDRRTFLQGMGATVALPLLDAMIPARSLLAAIPQIGGARVTQDFWLEGEPPDPGNLPSCCRWRNLASASIRCLAAAGMLLTGVAFLIKPLAALTIL
jgi:hypothetical protein